MSEKLKTIFDISVPGRKGCALPECDVPKAALCDMIPGEYLRKSAPDLPEVSEVDVVRHFTRLSQKNYGVDAGFYPLGSCTMKYNPKVDEDAAALRGFEGVHPLEPAEASQGCLQVLYETEKMLAEITGMERMTFQPAAGAHGELTGLMIIKAYHEHRNDLKRDKIIIPDSAHGTNPASAAEAGFKAVEVKSDENGNIDIENLKTVVGEDTAGLMLTNPNTLGLFDGNILKIAEIVHNAGGLLYYDGANSNAIVGICRPGDMGFDAVHLNLHKTFAAPHGGGGPGSGPVGVKKELVEFLPGPVVEYENGKYRLDCDRPLSIGRVKEFYGNFGVIVKAYAYILSLGAKGLEEVSKAAVLNANYVRAMLKDYYSLPFDRPCMHEVVFSASHQKELGVSANDIAKRLIDYGYHPPTVYFPLIVREAMMIEPTETENLETLDDFIGAMIKIAKEAKESPELVTNAPHNTEYSKFDETTAARNPVVTWKQAQKDYSLK